MGKTKRFTVDRMVAIAQFLASMELEGADEQQLVNQSADFYACANTLVTEGLLKKASMRIGVQTQGTGSGTATDDFINVGFKCNFDSNFISEVADKMDFALNEFLFSGVGVGDADD